VYFVDGALVEPVYFVAEVFVAEVFVDTVLFLVDLVLCLEDVEEVVDFEDFLVFAGSANRGFWGTECLDVMMLECLDFVADGYFFFLTLGSGNKAGVFVMNGDVRGT